MAGNYFVTITGNGGIAVSNSTNLSVIPIAKIAMQPLAIAMVCGGEAQSYSVSATGANLSYLWSNGATGTTINTSIAGTYLVTVSGSCGKIVSSPASLGNYLPTAIVTQPLASATICSGLAQTYTVSARGSDLLYAWSNALSSTATMTTSTAGTYSVTVTGTCGSAISNVAELVVNSCSVTGVSSSSATYSFEIYPNPTTGCFVIDVPLFEKVEHLSYTVSTIESKILSTGQLTAGKNNIEVPLTKGIYLVKVGSMTKKLIIE